ncbi:MAG: ATP synthase F1 subunit gamma [Gemmatimonadota bacterium]|nr:ATP synthase F1 subunit gamma [Gemmatimonadota bacterium]MDE2676584.1 ATP synthase F1 subunit gamma [Gemmatimonadota bacterium]MDE2751010.1 ATP synthase F1 subunit gamma [Gemmatimonadota bacterium]MXX36012.1 ATP synthase F1 subunit gamma [Gemmatimonadota bacterium]MYD14759.1 ATP synthase F1 subunit gamma [Gemmatimonadota bacterium]
MAQARDVLRRIKSVRNTRKITRTMELVATSKLKRAMDRMLAARPYGEALDELLRSLRAPGLEQDHPLLRQPAGTKRAAVLLLTANRGFCGAFNANLIREARTKLDELEAGGVETELHIAGKKGLTFFRFRGRAIASGTTAIGDEPRPEDAEGLVEPLAEAFASGGLDAVYLVSSKFRSAMSTPPRTRRILPVQPDEGARSVDAFIVSPPPEKLVGWILPRYLRSVVYGALVENAAGEQGARRAAMKSATDNAGEMIETLTRSYNRARQAQITQEIAEIVGGAAALE